MILLPLQPVFHQQLIVLNTRATTTCPLALCTTCPEKARARMVSNFQESTMSTDGTAPVFYTWSYYCLRYYDTHDPCQMPTFVRGQSNAGFV